MSHARSRIVSQATIAGREGSLYTLALSSLIDYYRINGRLHSLYVTADCVRNLLCSFAFTLMEYWYLPVCTAVLLFLADRTNGRAYATVLRLSSSSVTLFIVAKRCVLEQKLLLRAYRKSYMRNRLVPK